MKRVMFSEQGSQIDTCLLCHSSVSVEIVTPQNVVEEKHNFWQRMHYEIITCSIPKLG